MSSLLIVINDNDERATRLMGAFEHTAEIFGGKLGGGSRLDLATARLGEGVRLTKRLQFQGKGTCTEFIAEAVKLISLEDVAYQVKKPPGTYAAVIRVGEPGGM